MISFPNIKINLGLHVINKREDGYHTIETVFYPVSYGDMLEVITNKVSSTSSKVFLQTEGLTIQGNQADNLIIKAYELLDSQFNLPPATFFLYKKIPMGAGLGGGSSDGAFAIKLLNDHFQLKLSMEQMQYYAAQLGSDCAFFIQNKPAYAFGRGSELEDIAIDLSSYYISLLFPDVHSGTAAAYQHVRKRGKVDEAMSLKTLIQQPVEQWRAHVENDFEYSVFRAIPQLAQLKEQLYECGAIYASMSGSGSAMFGIFDRQPQLTRSLKEIEYYSGKL
jgi:4-diphosphocytidyl-2-C-methyl-D-erythritol kinase